MRFFASCWLSIVCLRLIRQEHIDLPESRRRAAVAHGVDLSRLALTVEEGAELLPVRRARDPVARVPEIRGLRLVSYSREHPALLTTLDLPECVAAELEVIALLIDRKAPIAFDQDA